MKPRLSLRLQAALRSLSRLSFTDSLVLIFLIIGALWLLRFAITSARGQGFPSGYIIPGDPLAVASRTELRDSSRRSAVGKAAAFSRDLDREVEGKIQRVDMTWFHFYGRVTGVLPEGINISGYYGPANGPILQTDPITFFVTHFPFEVAEGDELALEDWFLAKGVHSYHSPFKGPRAIPHLDCGIPVRLAPAAPQDLNAVLTQARKARAEMDALMLARAATNQVAATLATNPPAPSTTSAK